MKKIKIIDEICKRHPSYGVEKGWSEYVGGMRDSGQWFYRKMLNHSKKELKLFLDEIILEESKPKTPLTEQEKEDCGIFHELPNGGWITEYSMKNLQRFNEEMERKLIFGQ